ncbi:MAG: hypothetical protein K1X88_26030 [Nannocystaceae bacterium]|nr:hypothetical protein [Nannocystaceae bacterium]
MRPSSLALALVLACSPPPPVASVTATVPVPVPVPVPVGAGATRADPSPPAPLIADARPWTAAITFTDPGHQATLLRRSDQTILAGVGPMLFELGDDGRWRQMPLPGFALREDVAAAPSEDPIAFGPTTLLGRWPDDATMVIEYVGYGRAQPPSHEVHHRGRDGRWHRIDRHPRQFSRWPRRIDPWRDGSTMTWFAFARTDTLRYLVSAEAEQQYQRDAVAALVQREPQLRVTKGRVPPPNVRFDDGVDDVRWFPDGVVYVLRGGEAASLQRIDTVRETVVTHAVDGTLARPIEGWDARAADDVWAWGSGLEPETVALFHFDGTRWREQPTPCHGSLWVLRDVGPAVLIHCSVRFGPDDHRGALLALREGQWRWLGMPEAADPVAALSRGDGFVVLMRESGGAAATLWLEGATTSVQFPGTAELLARVGAHTTPGNPDTLGGTEGLR